jgi:hypothetical protein
MAQRASGYERAENELYQTPAWVTHALGRFIPKNVRTIWEPACATGKMVSALREELPACTVTGTDLFPGFGFSRLDFLEERLPVRADAIITNPPYLQAAAFIERALEQADFVAMLLSNDYHHASGRAYLFEDCEAFCMMVALRRRIKWFEDPRPGKRKQNPSTNHAWYIWKALHRGPPTIAYAP